MKRLPALIASFIAVLALSPAGSALAGGWAVSTLDPMPPLEPGSDVEIGFTVRQHGVTPVDLGKFSGAAVGIELTTADGERQLFAARPRGPVGHYVAAVTVPAAGTYRWQVLQGAFGAQDLGSIQIGGGTAATGSDDGVIDPLTALRWSSLGVAAGLAGVAALELTRRRSASSTHDQA